MSLSNSLPTLKQEIESALKQLRDSGKNQNANSDSLISQFANQVANAIKKYMESADVVTHDNIFPGQSTAAPIPPQVGAGIYSSPGVGSGTGKLRFTSSELLKIEIENAYKKSKDNGKRDFANASSVISSLSEDFSNAVHNFALTAIVETDVNVNPGVFVSGYVNSLSGVPFPSFS